MSESQPQQQSTPPPPRSRRFFTRRKAVELVAVVLSVLAAVFVQDWVRQSWGTVAGFAAYLACFMLCSGAFLWVMPKPDREPPRLPDQRTPRFGNRVKGRYHNPG